MATLKLFICFLVSSSCLLFPIICYEDDDHQQHHIALFIFGDSLFDAGANNYINTTTENQANFRPYGETFFKHPTGRFTDGRLIPDFIAEYANLPLIPTYLASHNDRTFTYGANFASGGGGALVETHLGFVVDLKTQLSQFETAEKKLTQKLGDEGAKSLLSEAVYMISIGGNDYIVFTSNSSVHHSYKSKKEYVGMVLGNLTTIIKEIYKKGGRKFSFVNLVPLGCLPGVKTLLTGSAGNSCVESAQEMAKLHNQELPKLLQKLESQLKGFKYASHDIYNSLNERINHPSKYGFKEATACCGSGPERGIYSCGGMRGIKEFELCENPGEYLFFDSNHPSEKAYRQIAELIWSGTPDVTGPYNLQKLFQHI